MSQDFRSRMISFRLSAEEYEKLRDFCFDTGTRSISQTARAAINMLLQQQSRAPAHALEARVADLEGRLHMLALEIKTLNQLCLQRFSPSKSNAVSAQSNR